MERLIDAPLSGGPNGELSKLESLLVRVVALKDAAIGARVNARLSQAMHQYDEESSGSAGPSGDRDAVELSRSQSRSSSSSGGRSCRSSWFHGLLDLRQDFRPCMRLWNHGVKLLDVDVVELPQ